MSEAMDLNGADMDRVVNRGCANSVIWVVATSLAGLQGLHKMFAGWGLADLEFQKNGSGWGMLGILPLPRSVLPTRTRITRATRLSPEKNRSLSFPQHGSHVACCVKKRPRRLEDEHVIDDGRCRLL